MAVNESNTIQYTVTTSRVTDGTTLYWKTTGNTTNADIVGGNTGSITITNNRALLNVTISSDGNTDGTKTLGITILTGSVNGTPVVNTASDILISDTSLTPILGFSSVPSSINEGSVGTFNVTSSLSNGSTAYWTINNVTSTGADFNEVSGSFTITSGVGSFTVTPFADQTTEGTETFTVSLRTGSISGTIEANSSSVIINDASTAPVLYVWGYNNSGQLGKNDTVDRSSPVQVSSAVSNWSQVATGGTTLAVKANGTLWLWGFGFYGDTGLGTSGANGYRSSPTQVGALTNWSKVARYTGSFAIKTDNTLWAWGNNSGGNLGINKNPAAGAYRTNASPIQLSGTDWAHVSAGTLVNHAIKTNGTLWYLGGDGAFGGFGNNTSSASNLYRSSPVQVGSLTNWTDKISSGYECVAIKTDGTLWSWGYNSSGQLGLNDKVTRSSPVQVGTDTNWTEVSAAGHTVAIRSNGTLWAWGSNGDGELGINITGGYRSSPVQVGSLTNWSKVSAGSGGSTFAIKTDGTLWAWGEARFGRLGTNNLVYTSSPVQIGSTAGWTFVKSGTLTTVAIGS